MIVLQSSSTIAIDWNLTHGSGIWQGPGQSIANWVIANGSRQETLIQYSRQAATTDTADPSQVTV